MNVMRMLLVAIASATTSLALTQPPQKAEPNQQLPATPQANAGSQNATSPATVMPPAGESNATLQGRIQQGLQNESTLDGSHISVNVTENSIELSGSVPSSEDKQTAQRIAQSFGGNRKFSDTLTVTGQAPAAAAGSGSNPGTTQTPQNR